MELGGEAEEEESLGADGHGAVAEAVAAACGAVAANVSGGAGGSGGGLGAAVEPPVRLLRL